MAETLEDDLEGAESDQEWLEAEPDDLEDTDAAVEDDAESDDSTESEEGDKEAGDDTEALDQLEAEELEMLTEDEEAESLPIDEAEELRQIRSAAMSLESSADTAGDDEFVCSSCFLVKAGSQLADKRKKLCLDCA
jgi:hypothetical protein